MKMVEECPTYGLSGPLTIKDEPCDTEEILPLLNKLPNLQKGAIKRENCDRFSSEEYIKRQKLRSEHTDEEINENLDGEFDIESKWLKRKLEISEEQDTRMKRESSVEFVEHDPLNDSRLVSEEDGNDIPGSKIIPLDFDFSDVVQWSFYPNHGTNLMYWQENYVKKVLAAVRFGKINLTQAADILGVAIRTATTRYRLEYGLVHTGSKRDKKLKNPEKSSKAKPNGSDIEEFRDTFKNIASKMYLKGSSKGPKVEESKVETADTNGFNDTFRNIPSKTYVTGSSKRPKVEESKVETADTNDFFNDFNDTFRNIPSKTYTVKGSSKRYRPKVEGLNVETPETKDFNPKTKEVDGEDKHGPKGEGMKVETAENKGVNPKIEGVDGKDKHGPKFERLKVETAETMVVNPQAAEGLDAKDKHRCGSGAAGVELQRVLPPSTMMMDGLTAFPRDPFPDAVKYSDFAQGNSSQMFWEQDYVRRVFKALTVGEMDLKEVSKILGVTVNTIRLQYRKLYGFSYSSSGKMGPSAGNDSSAGRSLSARPRLPSE